MLKKLLVIGLIALSTTSFAQSDSVVVKFSPQNSHDAIVSLPFPNGADTASPSIVTAFWSGNGKTGPWRTYMKVDLSSIPANVIIDSAFVDLYADPSSQYGNVGNPVFGTDNASSINRVLNSWTKGTISWVNQPAVTSLNQAILPQSGNVVQDFEHVDITGIIYEMYNVSNNGIMLKNINESGVYNSMIFHSGLSTDSMKRPRIVVYYHDDNVGLSNNILSAVDVNISPLPCHNNVSIEVRDPNRSGMYTVLVDALGRELYTNNIKGGKEYFIFNIDMGVYPSGVYYLNIKASDGILVRKKIIKQ